METHQKWWYDVVYTAHLHDYYNTVLSDCAVTYDMFVHCLHDKATLLFSLCDSFSLLNYATLYKY